MAGSNSTISVKMPRGEHASFEEMQNYGSVLQSFIYEQELMLEEIPDTQQHNDTVDYLHSLANSYNEQLRIYKEAESQRQRSLIAALMQMTQTSG